MQFFRPHEGRECVEELLEVDRWITLFDRSVTLSGRLGCQGIFAGSTQAKPRWMFLPPSVVAQRELYSILFARALHARTVPVARLTVMSFIYRISVAKCRCASLYEMKGT